jgi:ATP-dependent helicase YprA (DUF1998 family)
MAFRLNFQQGNRARKRCTNLRVWAMQRSIADEINPKICREDLETRLADLGITQDTERPARQANRRKTDSKGLRGGGGEATFFHPELGKPEVGVRMVSVCRRNEGLEVELDSQEIMPVNNNLEVNP